MVVSAVRCQSYDVSEVEKAIDSTFVNLGGIDQFVSKGDRVFLKLNLIIKKDPKEAATTHPAVVEAVVRKLISKGATVVIGDSPGGPYNKAILQNLYRVCGIEKVAEDTGAELNFDCSYKEYNYTDGVATKKLTLIEPLMNCDKVISISKLKTHGMTLYTGAVKVMFGTIPGLTKAEYHFKMPDIKDFSNLLVDICQVTKPELSIIDGVYGMEGDGPTAGSPVKSNIILASKSPYDVDIAGAHVMGIDPFDVPTIQRAIERGLSEKSIDHIQVVGEKLDDFKKQYKTPNTKHINFIEGKFPKPIERFLNRRLSPKPVFVKDICVGCGKCKEACPPKAIEMVNRRPKVDFDKCIKCFCCQELCPKKAVEVKRSFIANIILK